MGKDPKSAPPGPKARPAKVPQLKLDGLNGAAPSQGKNIPRKGSNGSGNADGFAKMATPRSQAFSPPQRSTAIGSLKFANSTPDSARGKRAPFYSQSSGIPYSGSHRPSSGEAATPRTFIGGRTFSNESMNGGARRQTSLSDHRAAQANQLEPMMTPRGSYRDILITPRGGTGSRMDLAGAVAAHRPVLQQPPHAQHPKQQTPVQEAQQQKQQQESRRSQDAEQQQQEKQTYQQQEQQQRALHQQCGRASQEHDHVQQQITSLEVTIQAQQAALVANIATVQSLGLRRDRLANDAAALQTAVTKAQAAATSREAEIQELEVLIAGLQATLNASQEKEESSGGAASAAATSRLSLLQVMQAAATALRLPGVSRALEAEAQVAGGSSARRGTSVSFSGTARSEISTSRFATPAGSVRELGPSTAAVGSGGVDGQFQSLTRRHDVPADDGIISNENIDVDSEISDSEDGENDNDTDTDSVESSSTGIISVPPQPPRVLPSQRKDTLQRPGVTLPPLQLPVKDTGLNAMIAAVPAAGQSSSRGASAAALARLQSIRSKLEVAEAILTARVPEDGEPLTLE